MIRNNHFLVVTFPAQGHINPALQFAKSLIRTGAQVTFTTTVSAHKRMLNTTSPQGLAYTSFSDGYDDGFKSQADGDALHFMSEIKRCGSQKLRDLILSSANENRPITCLIYTPLLPWAADVARDLNIQSALLWIQPATVFDVYYYYFNGYKNVILGDESNVNDPSFSVKLPGLPLLTSRDLPSFLVSSNTYSFAIPIFEEQFKALEKETNPRVLVNTFDALESEAIRAIHGFSLVGIGPLVPSAFLDGKDPSDTSFGGDLFHSSTNYTEWLNSKEKSSVVYVSFGSIAELDTPQKEEIARGLVESGLSFLWVIRQQDTGSKEEKQKEESMILRRIKEENNEQGIIVSWCSQLEVLAHASVGCFMSHCGWNSTLESLVRGVPMVAFPQWTDQGTNAKLIEDVWRTGVRVRVKDGEKIVKSEELRLCLEIVMGERGEEMRKNAKKWKDLAREAVEEGGSSDRNLRAFVDEVGSVGHE